MSQNGISTEVVHAGCGAVDPIATKIQRRTDKLALAQCTRGYTTYGYRPLNQISGTHQAYVNGACGPSLQTLSGTNSPAVGHPWSKVSSIDTVLTSPAEIGTLQQVAGITYVTSATTFINNGVATNPDYGSIGFFLKSFTTATSNALNAALGNPISAPGQFHSGVFHAAWSTGSSALSSFVTVVHAIPGTGTEVGNADGTSLYFSIQDGQNNDIRGTWIFPVTLTLVQQTS